MEFQYPTCCKKKGYKYSLMSLSMQANDNGIPILRVGFVHWLWFFFGYSLGPKMVDPILTFVLPISICRSHKNCLICNLHLLLSKEAVFC